MTTKIEWAEETWNPIKMRCTPVSEGCQNCYALAMLDRNLPGFKRYPKPGQPPILDEKTLTQPLRWKKPRVIFVESMGDLFHEAVKAEMIMWLWNVMYAANQHTYIILTKRPERMCEILKMKWFNVLNNDHIYLGTTLEKQEHEHRVVELLETPAAHRFVSIEPMLGPVDLGFPRGASPSNIQYPKGFDQWSKERQGEWFHAQARCTYMTRCEIGIDLVILGGESGRNARPMHPDWAMSVRDQCEEAGVPFYFKQWGEYAESIPLDKESATLHIYKHGTSFYRMGKKETGRLLNGREHNDLPWRE